MCVTRGSTRRTYTDTGDHAHRPVRPVSPTVLAGLATQVPKFDETSPTVPLDAPWVPPDAAEWVSRTLALANSPTERFRELAAADVAADFRRRAGGAVALFDTRDGARMPCFVDGSRLISLMVAKQLGKRGVKCAPAMDRPVPRPALARSPIGIWPAAVGSRPHCARSSALSPPALASPTAERCKRVVKDL